MTGKLSKGRLSNLASPDLHISALQSSDPSLYRAIKNLGDASKQIINSTFPPVPALSYRSRIIIPGTLTESNDILSHRYHVVLPIDQTGYWKYKWINLTDCYITAKVLGTVSSTSIDIKISQQKGTTAYKSLFKPGMNPIIPSNVSSTHDVQFAINTLYQDDLGRVDVLATDAVIAGLEIVLIGNYSVEEVKID